MASEVAPLLDAFDSLSSRALLIFGGKGGVGKTTISTAAALHLSRSHEVVLLTTDPASNLRDMFEGPSPAGLTIEQFEAEALYRAYLEENLESFLVLGDRGTYLDRDELRRFFELALPGIDELMGWMHIGDVVRERPHAIVIVDSAPTGHTLRLLGSSAHFDALGAALESMQSKHRELVEQLTRRRVRDALDDFLESFHREARERVELISDRTRTAFVPVFLAEPWVVEQTRGLAREVRAQKIDIPFLVMNRTAVGCACARCTAHLAAEREARPMLPGEEIICAPRSCLPLDSESRLRTYLEGGEPASDRSAPALPPGTPLSLPSTSRLLFVAGKGGVGKTSTAASIGMQLAERHPQRRITIISVDPAHGLKDALGGGELPPHLTFEINDTRERWNRLRARIGDEIEKAIGALTGSGVRVLHDTQVLKELVEIAPPGADELFAIMRLHELSVEAEQDLVIVDTAPTGHFLRLLELPRTAGEWVREFMRILLRYRELIPPSSLGEQLLHASRALTRFEELLSSPECACIVVTRPERVVLKETTRLLETLRDKGIAIGGIVANAVTPRSDCTCDALRRAAEETALAELGEAVTLVEERERPPTSLADLRGLIPLGQTAGEQ